ncbi:MAG TPA: TIGR00269 family protein [Nitrososphaerales archaeon]|nr:TIGR00269 family protein [Nitrososphaerales archaeon]
METAAGKPKPQCRCGGKTVYFRAYNGESLCSSCFTSSIFEKVKKTISKHGMLRYGDRVGVALSGGKDSTSLLQIMHGIMKGHGSQLFAITIDEGIEGYREESVKNAEKIASELSIPLTIRSYKEYYGLSLDEAMESRSEKGLKITSCAACGPLRRRAIDQAAGELGVNVVATAHNLDDILQTFYINLYSGDIERIGWLNPEFRPISDSFKLRRIKPAMEIYEQELAFFAYLNHLPFQTESCPYMNEGIRTEIRNHLNELERRHPGVKYSTFKTVMMLSKGLAEAPASKVASRCEKCGSVSSSSICSVCQTLAILQ